MSSWGYKCNQCKRSIGDKMCFIPNGVTGFVDMRVSKDVYRWEDVPCEEGMVCDAAVFVCDYYDPESKMEMLGENIKKPFNKFLRAIDAVRDFFRFSVFGRIKYGFDPRDSWDVSSATSKFILPRLRKFIDDKPQGCPCGLTIKQNIIDDDLSKYFDGELQDEWFVAGSDIHENYKAWINILEEIYFGLKYKADNDEERYGKNIEELLDLQDRVNESFRLYGLFFENLWD